MKKKLILFSVSVALSLVAVELAVRLVGVERVSPHLVVDQVLHVQKPHAAYSQKREGRAAGRYNRHGLRDLDIYDRAKPENVTRILVFGDSHTEALQVEQELDFDISLQNNLCLN